MAANGRVQVDAGKCIFAVGSSCNDSAGTGDRTDLSLADIGADCICGSVAVDQWHFYFGCDDWERIAGDPDQPAEMEVFVKCCIMYDTKYDSGNHTASFIRGEDVGYMQEFGWNLEFYRTIFTNYWWYGLFFVIYLGGLVYIVQQKSALMKQVFVWPFVILLLTVFNPLVMEPVLQVIDWRNRYSRFFWMLPVEILSAYMLARLVEGQQRIEDKTAMVIFVVCLVFLCGSSATEMELDDNIYKLDPSVIEVAERIEEASDKENPVVFYDEELYYWIRQYDPSLVAALKDPEMNLYRWLSLEEIDATEQYQNERRALSMFVRGVEVEPEIVNRAIESRKVDFFVRDIDLYSDEYLQQLNIVYVDTVAGYELYRCVHD